MVNGNILTRPLDEVPYTVMVVAHFACLILDFIAMRMEKSQSKSDQAFAYVYAEKIIKLVRLLIWFVSIMYVQTRIITRQNDRLVAIY